MSFILDALKKSEADRQQQSGPDISNVPTATSRAVTPRWLWILVGLLGINLLVLTVVLLKPSPTTESVLVTDAPVSVVVPTTAGNPTPDNQTPVLRADPPPTLPEEPVYRESKPAPEALQTELPVRRSDASAKKTQLTFNDLRASGNVNLPDLNIDIHVYSEKPADRFVFINMNQYRENATLTEGPLLREITTEGVILEFVGATFLLPRE